jgi:dTMP kinase
MDAKFVTVEGLDGAGKSTHLAWLRNALEARGVSVCATREPGGTQFGEALREMMLHPAHALHPESETLLMFAARREHVDKVIRPALAAGTWVLCDRFTDASFAYQACGSGVEWRKVEILERWVQDDLQPDLTLYFDVEPHIARSRIEAKSPDRFEKEQAAFHEAVRAGYLRRAVEHARRFRIIDASGTLSDIQVELSKHLESLCSTAPGTHDA